MVTMAGPVFPTVQISVELEPRRPNRGALEPEQRRVLLAPKLDLARTCESLTPKLLVSVLIWLGNWGRGGGFGWVSLQDWSSWGFGGPWPSLGEKANRGEERLGRFGASQADSRFTRFGRVFFNDAPSGFPLAKFIKQNLNCAQTNLNWA